MSLVAENADIDARGRILTTAERLFRDIGYQKTTVADIAKSLGMSPANVYRFFDSKKSIHEGVARRLMSEVESAAKQIATAKRPAETRLREMLATIHHMNAERYVADCKMHEMVAVAMEQSWDVCRAHYEYITTIIGEVVADGMASGEFAKARVDRAAFCTSTAMARFFHPQLIAQCADKPGPTLDEMIDFVVRGLKNPN